jgi:hypothetical protein
MIDRVGVLRVSGGSVTKGECSVAAGQVRLGHPVGRALTEGKWGLFGAPQRNRNAMIDKTYQPADVEGRIYAS